VSTQRVDEEVEVGLWSRFWSVVPKAVVKSGRDAFTRDSDPTSMPETTSAEEILADEPPEEASGAAASPSGAEDGPSVSPDVAAEVDDEVSDEAPAQPRKRTL